MTILYQTEPQFNGEGGYSFQNFQFSTSNNKIGSKGCNKVYTLMKMFFPQGMILKKLGETFLNEQVWYRYSISFQNTRYISDSTVVSINIHS